MQEKPPGGAKVVNELGFLALHLDGGNFQSLMRKSRPNRLELGYTRTMMGFVLFNPEPKDIGMIGLGGGSLAKHCLRTMPSARITAVEINAEVIALREQFHIPPDNERFSIVCADGADFVAGRHDALDVLLVDGFDNKGQVPALCSRKFYDDCYAGLREEGVLVVNILGEDPGLERYLEDLRASFADQVRVVGSEDCENRIVFAIKGGVWPQPQAGLLERAALMERRHVLKFGALLEQLLRA